MASSYADWVLVDGSRGEGGGQVLRSALTSAVLSRRPVRIVNIRAGRPKPGLQKQHLACVTALAAVVDGAVVSGAALQSTELTFDPRAGAVAGGEYAVDVGSAGSTGLVLQTVLPVLLRLAPRASTLTLTGGTHNPLAPPFPFLRDALAPLLAAAGARVQLTLTRPGFYPAGGGTVVARVEPLAAPVPLALLDRGRLVSRSAAVLLANLPADIGRREAAEFARVSGWPASSVDVQRLDAAGPGNVVTATLTWEHTCDVVSAYGEKKRRGEDVAREAADAAVAAERRDPRAAVGENLSDQLLLPLLVGAGGRFTLAGPAPSSHFVTNVDVLRQFFGDGCVTYAPLPPEADDAAAAASTASSSSGSSSASASSESSAVTAPVWLVTVQPSCGGAPPAPAPADAAASMAAASTDATT